MLVEVESFFEPFADGGNVVVVASFAVEGDGVVWWELLQGFT